MAEYEPKNDRLDNPDGEECPQCGEEYDRRTPAQRGAIMGMAYTHHACIHNPEDGEVMVFTHYTERYRRAIGWDR